MDVKDDANTHGMHEGKVQLYISGGDFGIDSLTFPDKVSMNLAFPEVRLSS